MSKSFTYPAILERQLARIAKDEGFANEDTRQVAVELLTLGAAQAERNGVDPLIFLMMVAPGLARASASINHAVKNPVPQPATQEAV